MLVPYAVRNRNQDQRNESWFDTPRIWSWRATYLDVLLWVFEVVVKRDLIPNDT